MLTLLKKCCLCPRNCGINRYETTGVCGAGDKIKLAFYSIHEWEEPIISGTNGSGTIFFSHCNLKCIFCQNKKISTDGYGKEIDNDKLIDIMYELQNKGVHNINLVTPTHYVPQIVLALRNAKSKKLNIPVVYNTSSYENTDTIRLLNGLIDVYLADLKYYDNNLASNYSKAPNYFEVAVKAIDEMYKQVGNPVIKDGILKKGLIVRVLILPGHVDDAKKIIEYLWKKYNHNIYISIMNQYTPIKSDYKFENLNRRVSDTEYDEVVDFACNLGILNAFIQDGLAASESFIPDFDSSII